MSSVRCECHFAGLACFLSIGLVAAEDTRNDFFVAIKDNPSRVDLVFRCVEGIG